MIDYHKPIIRNGKSLKILQVSAHACIRKIKKTIALKKLGYEVHGLANQISYGTENFDTYSIWRDEKQFKNALKMYLERGIDIVEWNNEPDHPAWWAREVIDGAGMSDKVKLIVDFHDLDSIRRGFIPKDERMAFNAADGIVYCSIPIQKMTNKLHQVTKPNIVLYSYCNEGVVEWNEKDIPNRTGLVYEGGANPVDDIALEQQFAYRSLYNIIKRLVEMGNEVHMYCGNLGAFETYQHTGAVLYPPTMYDEMMKGLTKRKYGILIFNNEDGEKDQVNYTLTNKEMEYLQAGLPSLACWCPESMRHVQKHKIGFVFEHIDEIRDCSHLEKYYPEVMENIKQKRKELVMENYIVLLENLYADVLGVERKWIPDHIQKLHDFDFKG